MTLYPAVDYIQVAGKIDVLIAVPVASYVAPAWDTGGSGSLAGRTGGFTAPTTNAGAYLALFKLGELEDEVEPRQRKAYVDVPGDRHGGRNGPPIEKQILPYSLEIELMLSRFDPLVLAILENNGGVTEVPGRFPLSSVGALVLRDRSFRLLLRGVRDYTRSQNFPCCLVESSRSISISSKYSRLTLGIGAHRAPEGHWGVQSTGGAIGTIADLVTGVIDNADTSGTS